MSKTVIVAADKIIDGQGNLDRSQAMESRIRSQNITPVSLVIDPLKAGWHSPVADNHFRSGCAPIEALKRAFELINNDGEHAVIISGEELLKTGYDREERLRLMAIYGSDYPITEAYNELAGQFILNSGASESLFKQCAEGLFNNYKKTFLADAIAKSQGDPQIPGDKWFNPITSRFRGVDCANPLIDFNGRLVLVSDALARELGVGAQQQVAVSGVDVQILDGDGREYIDQISTYEHLRLSFLNSCEQAGVNFSSRFKNQQALLEVYSCYPVVPMAFMLVSGLIRTLAELPELLKSYAVTVTGGMNLARAPWNNPALNGLITMYQQLQADTPQKLAAVHGNGGLGYRQGVAILEQLD
ncbi:hypothetical protein [Motiliproteus sp. MSK22-1]|uniref:hypothetical protein n=1 Tax=Motiliproteus sp. MSK22-1 TaxID=1897630 RepID=UPI000977A96C|nr:hypothetical protein [Motiliproteus sp. MSK22-1]OMH32711.1 hypothetical protein BGP75_14355 [Motiliproteus sp. MSK22-1]